MNELALFAGALYIDNCKAITQESTNGLAGK